MIKQQFGRDWAPLPAAPTLLTKQRKTHGRADEQKYLCSQTNYDNSTSIQHAGQLAKFLDFSRPRHGVQSAALVRWIESWSASTAPAWPLTRTVQPNLAAAGCEQGWLQNLQAKASQRVFSQPAKLLAAWSWIASAAADHKAARTAWRDRGSKPGWTLAPNAGDLVAITGRDLLNDGAVPLVNDPASPPRLRLWQTSCAASRLGGSARHHCHRVRY